MPLEIKKIRNGFMNRILTGLIDGQLLNGGKMNKLEQKYLIGMMSPKNKEFLSLESLLKSFLNVNIV
jgi:hypothetical protein